MVAPLVGAWIEIAVIVLAFVQVMVAPLVGAWIEIHIDEVAEDWVPSLPLWERGLKSFK